MNIFRLKLYVFYGKGDANLSGCSSISCVWLFKLQNFIEISDVKCLNNLVDPWYMLNNFKSDVVICHTSTSLMVGYKRLPPGSTLDFVEGHSSHPFCWSLVKVTVLGENRKFFTSTVAPIPGRACDQCNWIIRAGIGKFKKPSPTFYHGTMRTLCQLF